MFIFTTNSATGHVRILASLPKGTPVTEINKKAEALAIGAKGGKVQVYQLCGEVRAVNVAKWEPKP